MKKWVSGEFKTPKELIVALLGEEKVYSKNNSNANVYLDENVYVIVNAVFSRSPDDVCLADFGYMREVPWHLDIPEHGVLCWCRSSPDGVTLDWTVNVIIKGIPNGHKLISGFSNFNVFFDEVKPLTNEEIKQFLRVEE